jgi:hypothetical protein
MSIRNVRLELESASKVLDGHQRLFPDHRKPQREVCFVVIRIELEAPAQSRSGRSQITEPPPHDSKNGDRELLFLQHDAALQHHSCFVQSFQIRQQHAQTEIPNRPFGRALDRLEVQLLGLNQQAAVLSSSGGAKEESAVPFLPSEGSPGLHGVVPTSFEPRELQLLPRLCSTALRTPDIRTDFECQ